MISTSDFRTGTTVTIDGDAWQVIDFQHVKPGKGAAFVRAKIRNLCTGAVIERTFNPADKMPKAVIDRREMEYLYESDGVHIFMDTASFEQAELDKNTLGNSLNFIKENNKIHVMIYDGKIIGVDMPVAVELIVVETDPGIRGVTATGGTNPATMDTGYVVKVPLFINVGDKLRIDTRTGEYLERA